VNAITPLIENGKVYLDEEINLQNLISECEEFPNSEHDDIVDSISQFLNYARNKNNERFELITKRIEMKKYYM
jgi:predicted phage terminase large subunit-like protein